MGRYLGPGTSKALLLDRQDKRWRVVALRLQFSQLDIAKLFAVSSGGPACQPILLRGPQGTETAQGSIEIIPG